MNRLGAAEIRSLLCDTYPEHASIFDSVGGFALLERRPDPVPEAVVRVVAGQMLSTAVARVIYARVRELAAANTAGRSWLLGYDELRACGLSNGKCRTITGFAQRYAVEQETIDRWPELASDELFRQVGAFWGMSRWTASILGLFYFAHEDIFPDRDGTIRRALRILHEDRGLPELDPSRASPYRSYLALALWKAVDEGALF